MRKYSVDQWQGMIPDDSVHAAFLRRTDIAVLPQDEQESRWQTHLAKLDRFREWLSTLEACEVR